MSELSDLMDWLDEHGGDARHTDRWHVMVGGVETKSRNLVKALQEAKEKFGQSPINAAVKEEQLTL